MTRNNPPMARTRIKICGVTRVEDAVAAARAGADAIGLIFHAPAPRFVPVERVREILAAIPPFVTPVGVFVNADPREILDFAAIREHQDAGEFDDLPPLIAAGGLTPQNVADVVRQLGPWAVDVSSGVESKLGMKSREKIEDFVAAVRSAED